MSDTNQSPHDSHARAMNAKDCIMMPAWFAPSFKAILMTSIPEDFVRHLHADGHALAAFSEALSQWARRASLTDKTAFHLELILEELLANVIEHGEAPCLIAGHANHSPCLAIEMDVHVALIECGRMLQVEVRDNALPFNPLRLPSPDVDAPLSARRVGGLGVHFVKTLTQSLEYVRSGGNSANASGYNEIRLTIRSDCDASRHD